MTRLVLARMADLPKILFQHIQSFPTIKKPIIISAFFPDCHLTWSPGGENWHFCQGIFMIGRVADPAMPRRLHLGSKFGRDLQGDHLVTVMAESERDFYVNFMVFTIAFLLSKTLPKTLPPKRRQTSCRVYSIELFLKYVSNRGPVLRLVTSLPFLAACSKCHNYPT